MNINLTQNWRTPDKRGGVRLWTPGHYVIGVDMPANVAAAALKAGAAEEIEPVIHIEERGGGVAPKPAFHGSRQARRRNKMRSAAPENKAAVE
jgi:hypothetical protein